MTRTKRPVNTSVVSVTPVPANEASMLAMMLPKTDIKGEFKHGILKLFVPKKEAKPAVEEKKYIAIEG